MNSKIFETIGLINLDPAFLFIGLLLCCIALLIFSISIMKKHKRLEEKYDRFMRGKDAETLEDIVLKRFEEIEIFLLSNQYYLRQSLKTVF